MARFPSKVESLTQLRQRGLPVGSVIDVGVQTSTPELIQVYPDVHHLLFEPLEEQKGNIERNYSKVSHTLFQCAVSDSDGEGELGFVNISGGSVPSHSRVVTGHVSGNWKTRPIKTAKLDTILASGLGTAPYLLKVDVDGHEDAILQGAQQTLKKTSCIVIEAPVGSYVQRTAFIESHGFRLWDIVDLWYYDGVLSQVDLIFLSRELLKSAAFDPVGKSAWNNKLWQTVAR